MNVSTFEFNLGCHQSDLASNIVPLATISVYRLAGVEEVSVASISHCGNTPLQVKVLYAKPYVSKGMYCT